MKAGPTPFINDAVFLAVENVLSGDISLQTTQNYMAYLITSRSFRTAQVYQIWSDVNSAWSFAFKNRRSQASLQFFL